MKLSNKTYDVLKWTAIIGLPALASLFSALTGIWGIPFGSEIVATIVAVDTALGVVLGISTSNYNKTKKGE